MSTSKIARLGVFLLSFILTPVQAQWIQLPTPDVRIPLSMLCLSSSGDTIFVGTYRGLIYRSFDHGATWEELSTGLENLQSTYTFLREGNRMYAGTVNGVYRSTNFGSTWTLGTAGSPAYYWVGITSILRYNTRLLCGTDGGVYRSIDDGATWTYSSIGISGNPVSSLVTFGSTIFAGTMTGIFRSTNSGGIWTESDSGFPPETFRKRINTLLVDNGTIYAGSNASGLWKSTDGGDYWTQDTNNIAGQGNYPPSIYSLSKFRDTLYIGTQDYGVYILTEASPTWINWNANLPPLSYVYSLTINGDEIFAALHEGGVYRQHAGANTWEKMFSTFPHVMTPSAVGTAGSRLLVNGSAEFYNGNQFGLFSTANQGANWREDTSFNADYASKFVTFDGVTYALGGKIQSTTDEGLHWKEASDIIATARSLDKIGDTLVAGLGDWSWQGYEWGGMYVSTDDGTSWNLHSFADTSIVGLAHTGGGVFAAGRRSIMRANNLNSGWTPLSLTLAPGHEIYDLIVHGNALYAITFEGIFRSTDEGETWVAHNDGFPLGTFQAQPQTFLRAINIGKDLVLASPIGVYYTNGFSDWVPLNDGLSGSALVVASIASDGLTCTIATGAGVYSTEFDGDAAYRVYDGWNLMSVPIRQSPAAASAIFGEGARAAFRFQGTYQMSGTVENGPGYWVKFDASEVLDFQGDPIDADTIPVEARWNLIGAISDPIPVISVMSNPPGLTVSSFFGYDASGRKYKNADTLYPGKGYFVKSVGTGELVLASSVSPSPNQRVRIVAGGELPPAPPALAEDPPIVEKYSLSQNYPNPFNPSTVINYSLDREGTVRLTVFDILGRKVATLVDEVKPPGSYSVLWDATGLSTGIFVYRLESAGQVEVRRMLLVR